MKKGCVSKMIYDPISFFLPCWLKMMWFDSWSGRVWQVDFSGERHVCMKVDGDLGDKSVILTMLTFAFLSIAAKWMKIDSWRLPAATQPKSSTFIHRKGGLPKAPMQTWLFGTQTLPGNPILETLHWRIIIYFPKGIYPAFGATVFTQHLVTLMK